MDRGYIDEACISHVKQDLRSDVMIPLRKNMRMLTFDIGLAESSLRPKAWRRYRKYDRSDEGIRHTE
jgi:hypothetical protein